MDWGATLEEGVAQAVGQGTSNGRSAGARLRVSESHALRLLAERPRPQRLHNSHDSSVVGTSAPQAPALVWIDRYLPLRSLGCATRGVLSLATLPTLTRSHCAKTPHLTPRSCRHCHVMLRLLRLSFVSGIRLSGRLIECSALAWDHRARVCLSLCHGTDGIPLLTDLAPQALPLPSRGPSLPSRSRWSPHFDQGWLALRSLFHAPVAWLRVGPSILVA